MGLYKYQDDLVKNVLKELSESNTPVVLAAAPSSGKTIMGIEIAKKYKRVLILASGFTLIRDQWAVYLKELALDHHVLGKRFNHKLDLSKFHIICGIPQGLNKRVLKELEGGIDLLIIDEAHQKYLAGQMKNIIKVIAPKKQLLLTGSPSLYNSNQKFQVLGISIAELLKQNIVYDPKITLVNSTFNITEKDINKQNELKTNVKITDEQVLSTIEQVLPQITPGKTMIVLPRQHIAIAVEKFLKLKGLASEISISSLNTGQAELNNFINDPKKHYFLVVNRGIMGFDYSELQTIVDFSFTQNIDKLFQSICRLIRKPKSKNIKDKYYIKIVTDRVALRTHASVMTAVNLSQDTQYFSFSRDYKDPRFYVTRQLAFHLMNNRRMGDLKRLSFKDLPEIISMRDLSRLKCETNELVEVRFSDFTGKRRYALDSAIELARTCPSRKVFKKTFTGAYNYLQAANRLDLLNEIFPKKVIWDWHNSTKEENLAKLKKEALKYDVKYKWRMANSAGNKWLKKMGLENEITFSKKLTSWTKEKVLERAKDYPTYNKFRQQCGGAYEYAERHGLLDEIKQILPRNLPIGSYQPKPMKIQSSIGKDDTVKLNKKDEGLKRDREIIKRLIELRKARKKRQPPL